MKGMTPRRCATPSKTTTRNSEDRLRCVRHSRSPSMCRQSKHSILLDSKTLLTSRLLWVFQRLLMPTNMDSHSCLGEEKLNFLILLARMEYSPIMERKMRFIQLNKFLTRTEKL